MNQLKSQATINYSYLVHGQEKNGTSISNLNVLNYKEVNIISKKFLSSETSKPHEKIIITLLIENIGTLNASNIIINDDIEGLEVDQNSIILNSISNSNLNYSHEIKDNSLIIELDKLEASTCIYIKYSATLKNEFSSFISSAIIYADEAKPVETNKIKIEKKFAELVVSKRTAKDFVFYNSDLSYILTIENKGNEDAINVQITDLLPQTYILNDTDAIIYNDVAITNYIFDEETHSLKIYIPKVIANSLNQIVINGKIIK